VQDCLNDATRLGMWGFRCEDFEFQGSSFVVLNSNKKKHMFFDMFEIIPASALNILLCPLRAVLWSGGEGRRGNYGQDGQPAHRLAGSYGGR